MSAGTPKGYTEAVPDVVIPPGERYQSLLETSGFSIGHQNP